MGVVTSLQTLTWHAITKVYIWPAKLAISLAIYILCYNSHIRQPVSIFFARIVAKSLSCQIVIYFSSSPN